MALRQIVKIGEPVLRKKSKVVKEINDRIIELLDDMADTMYEADGVGLAAPQVGILKRVVVIDIGDGLIELINPEIIEDENDKLIKSKDFFDEKKKIKIYMEDGYVVGNFIPVERGGNYHGKEGKL